LPLQFGTKQEYLNSKKCKENPTYCKESICNPQTGKYEFEDVNPETGEKEVTEIAPCLNFELLSINPITL